MRKLVIAILSLASTPSLADSLMSQMMNNPKVMDYVKKNPSVMLTGPAFMQRHPDIEKRGAAALKDPAIRADLEASGLTEIMHIAMGAQREKAAKPVVKAAPTPAATKTAPRAQVAAGTPPAPKKVASAAPVAKTAPKSTPRLNTTYVVREKAGLTAARQKGLSLNSPGLHLTGKTRQVVEDGGRKSNWLQVADAKGKSGWVNIGAKYNIGGARAARVAGASAAPTLRAPTPQAPAEPAPATPKGPTVAELPAPKMPAPPAAEAPAAQPAATPAPTAAVTPTEQPTQEQPAKAEEKPAEVAKADAKPEAEAPKDEKECARDSKEFAQKKNVNAAFTATTNPFVKWNGPVSGIAIVPGKDKAGNEKYELALPLAVRTMLMGMEKSTSMRPARAPFEFMVCVDGAGKEPYIEQFGNKQYFSKDRLTVKLEQPGLPAGYFKRDADPATTGSVK